MSRYFFGVNSEFAAPLTKREIARLRRIAEKHGAGFVYYTEHGRVRYWFDAPNKGSPWDERIRAAVMAEVQP